jgi:hypothetical protein
MRVGAVVGIFATPASNTTIHYSWRYILEEAVEWVPYLDYKITGRDDQGLSCSCESSALAWRCERIIDVVVFARVRRCSFVWRMVVVVPLLCGWLLYDHVQKEGCDTSGGVPGVPTRDPSGEDIFGAMFGIFFAASVLPQITTALEAITSSDEAASGEEDKSLELLVLLAATSTSSYYVYSQLITSRQVFQTIFLNLQPKDSMTRHIVSSNSPFRIVPTSNLSFGE